MAAAAARIVLERFRWVGGHADVWRLFEDAEAFQAVVRGLVDPWRGREITKVCGIESRGFLLGGAVALSLGAGFVAVRKADGLFPGEKVSRQAGADYRGQRHTFRVQRAALHPGDRVLLVDDWAEIGSQALAARHLVEDCGATFAGLSLIVSQLPSDLQARLGPVAYLVRADQLGEPDADG